MSKIRNMDFNLVPSHLARYSCKSKKLHFITFLTSYESGSLKTRNIGLKYVCSLKKITFENPETQWKFFKEHQSAYAVVFLKCNKNGPSQVVPV